MAVVATVHVSGLREISKILRTMDAEHRKQVREAFKGVGRIIAIQAQTNAKIVFKTGVKGRSGDLVKKITPRSTQRGVMVVASARHGPKKYNYPGRLEFDQKLNVRRIGSGTGRFLYPAVEQKRDEATRELVKVLDWLEREWSL